MITKKTSVTFMVYFFKCPQRFICYLDVYTISALVFIFFYDFCYPGIPTRIFFSDSSYAAYYMDVGSDPVSIHSGDYLRDVSIFNGVLYWLKNDAPAWHCRHDQLWLWCGSNMEPHRSQSSLAILGKCRLCKSHQIRSSSLRKKERKKERKK